MKAAQVSKFSFKHPANNILVYFDILNIFWAFTTSCRQGGTFVCVSNIPIQEGGADGWNLDHYLGKTLSGDKDKY